MLQHLPFILFCAFFPHDFMPRILSVCNVTLEEAFVKYTLIQTIAYYSLLGGFSIIRGSNKTEVIKRKYALNVKVLLYLSILFYAVGLGAYFVFLSRIGGLQYLLNHISEKVMLQRGQYVLGLLNLFYIVPLMLMLRLSYTKYVGDKIFLVLSIITYLFIANSLGAREPTIVFVALLIIGYNYIFKPIVLSKKTFLRVAALVPFFIAYMMVVPFLRHDFKDDFATELSLHKMVKRYVYQTSYVYIDVFCCNYFNKDRKWGMDGYFAPIVAINAKGDKKDLPEVDQGVYFKSIVADKKYYKPPLPRGKLSVSSWPTENFGFAYANFLLPGIVFFYFLQGIIIGLVYKWRNMFHKNVVLIVLYVYVLLYFNFSSLRIAFFVKTLPLLFLCMLVYNKFVLLETKK
ncbi:hypothetical protein ACLI1A_01320 [Flavobacterium sp. RHBU_3]|uniref:hypothetical protein n=1 Tax=Flavobacterium sp. RHBU_3 TaxID=3391184 RepID=UPI003984C07D